MSNKPLQSFASPHRGAFAALSVAILCISCSNEGSTSSESGPPDAHTGSVVYDFSKGDSLAPREGWVFHNAGWELEAVPGTTGTKGLPFRYPGVGPGEYGMSEMRFSMARGDDFWISLRWHVPANYQHRHDTRLAIPPGQRVGWVLGDTIVGTDGTSWGTISGLDSTGIFLRFARKSYYDQVWNGTVRNRNRDMVATASGRSQWPTNNKFLAVWTDEYSGRGTGSTIVWCTELDWASEDKGSHITVAYSTGGGTGSGAPVSGGVLVRPQDVGKWIDLVFHGRFPSREGLRDGVVETWFRREGEPAWTKAHDIRDAALARPVGFPDSLRNWGRGYLMGWANSGYDQPTTFHISRIEHGLTRPAHLGDAP